MNIFDFVIDGYKEVNADTYIGIFGHPIKHTLSPVIHDNLSDIYGLSERYVPFHIEPEMDLSVCAKSAYDQGILGLNITVPYKQDIMKSLVDIDAAAKAIGAVNTLVRVEGGYKGYNTDMPGLAKAMMSEGICLENKNVIMLGAGGAARAVAYMCCKYGAKRVYVINRTFENAKKITDDMNKEFDAEIMIPVASADVIKDAENAYKNVVEEGKYIFIQCTSVGLHEEDGLPLILDEAFYEMAEAGVDLIYNPAETPFMKLMKKLNVKAMNGLKMLLYQGIMAYELWNKVSVSEQVSDEIYAKLYEAVYKKSLEVKKNNIVLIGYMGAGKTTVGLELAKKLGYKFLDTDAYIVEKAGMSINEIFAKYGEAYFRQFETDCLKELVDNTEKTIVSTGGGLPLRAENAELLKSMGKVYYLKADADTIYDRVKDSTDRPLLKCDNPKQRIIDMLQERGPKYEAAADVIMPTIGETLNLVVEYIVKDRM